MVHLTPQASKIFTRRASSLPRLYSFLWSRSQLPSFARCLALERRVGSASYSFVLSVRIRAFCSPAAYSFVLSAFKAHDEVA